MGKVVSVTLTCTKGESIPSTTDLSAGDALDVYGGFLSLSVGVLTFVPIAASLVEVNGTVTEHSMRSVMLKEGDTLEVIRRDGKYVSVVVGTFNRE